MASLANSEDKHCVTLRLSLPPSLQKPYLPRPGQLLDEPLTRMDGENPQQALEINRVVSDSGADQGGHYRDREGAGSPGLPPLPLFLCPQMLRLMGEGSLPPWQEQTMGTYLIWKAQRRPGLRDELFSQLVAQLWHNPDEQQSQRGWALMVALLSSFLPTPAMQKPLLK